MLIILCIPLRAQNEYDEVGKFASTLSQLAPEIEFLQQIRASQSGPPHPRRLFLPIIPLRKLCLRCHDCVLCWEKVFSPDFVISPFPTSCEVRKKAWREKRIFTPNTFSNPGQHFRCESCVCSLINNLFRITIFIGWCSLWSNTTIGRAKSADSRDFPLQSVLGHRRDRAVVVCYSIWFWGNVVLFLGKIITLEMLLWHGITTRSMRLISVLSTRLQPI